MLKLAWLVACKDLRLIFTRGGGMPQALLLGLLLIFMFSMAQSPGQVMPGAQAAAIFWLGSSFCQVLVFNQLYAIEEANSAREALIIAPWPLQGVWIGKAMSGFVLLVMAQLLFLPATIVFLGQSMAGPFLPGLIALAGGDAGICALGSLIGAAAQGQGGRESLLAILLFPLLVPVLLAGISLVAFSMDGQLAPSDAWYGVLFAFDAMFAGAGLLLFGFLYSGEE